MSDIVERLRLRRDPLTDGERAEAADKIEQQRADIAECYEDIKRMNADMNAEIFRRGAEIERLRYDRRAAAQQTDELTAEIARLRELLIEGVIVPQQLNANALSPVAWRKDYERRVREALGNENL
jgi:hypothetical protein